uniref:Rhodanese domain-containing protein n=1 Tax=Chaetoceros debilis TaxID=122233 RepID=A0A7S3QIV7_9STRA
MDRTSRQNRNRNAVSSTDGVISDDGGSAIASRENRSYNSLSLHEGIVDTNIGNDETESLFVNGMSMADRGSTRTAPYPPLMSSSRGHHHHQHHHPFRGLSKSASKLLSQDDQTLSELLSVDVGESNEVADGGVGVGVGGLSPSPVAANNDIHRPTSAAADNIQNNLSPTVSMNDGSVVESNNSSNRNQISNALVQNYLSHIRDLENKLMEKEKELEGINEEWEQKFESMKEQFEINHQLALMEQLCPEPDTEPDANTNTIPDDAPNKNYPPASQVYKMQEASVTVIEHEEKPPNLYLHKDDEVLEEARVAKLTADQLSRYSRQLLLSEGWGVKGQQKLLSSSVLVIGAGGIGSTVLLYLASSGVGNISVVDFDAVDMSNLHRQVIHTEAKVGMNKAVSASQAIKALNPTINCTPIEEMLTFDNVMELVSKHDCVVDACDNQQTRYMVNDACVLNGKPLISGSAMGSEGQLTVYNHKNSACYRCLYPRINSAEGTKSCSDNGVIGTVPGLIGILQATETLKLLTETGVTMHDRLIMYDSLRSSFMNIKKLPPRTNCAVCGPNATICSIEDSRKASSKARGPTQCALPPSDSLPIGMHITSQEYYKVRQGKISHVLLDVRVKEQFELCSLEGAVNIALGSLEEELTQIQKLTQDGTTPVYCLCRRGIASIEATKKLSILLPSCKVYNIKGGLNSWKAIDPLFPMY